MKNNQGFSLIELIVVIAILGVIAGISTNSSSSVSNQEVKDFANAYDAMLSECKVETMSGMSNLKLQLYVNDEKEYSAILYKDNDKNGYYNESEDEEVRNQYLGQTYLTCMVSTDSGVVSLGEIANKRISLSFDRFTGGITTSFTKVSVSNGRKTYSIELIPVTGYHKIVQDTTNGS